MGHQRLACALPVFATMLAAIAPGCRRQHIAVDNVPEVPYPSCGNRPLPEGEVLATQHLRAGDTSLERQVNERYEIRRRDCLVIASVRQEWPRATADVEAVYDASGNPLRVWKRMTIPGVIRPDGMADTRRYELRTPEVTIKHRSSDGHVSYEILRGEKPRVIIGPGRGLLTVWIRRAHLAVGQRVREPALDVREQVEVIRHVTLQREPDMYLPWLGHTARVYTFYGRETVFADDQDTVIGDLAGLRPATLVPGPEPAPMPLYGTPDPVHTP